MITIIGDVGYDISLLNNSRSILIGGSGYHTVIGYLCVSRDVPYFLSSVGYDFNTKGFIQKGIPTEYLSIRSDIKTTCFYLDYSDGIRDVQIEMGASGFDCIEKIDANILESKYIHLAATDPVKQLRYISYLKGLGFIGKISADVFDGFCISKQKETRDVLKECDIVFMNREERQILGYEPSSRDVLYVFKLDKEGAEYYYSGEHVLISNTIKDKKAIDVTGAGDVLAGAFIGALASGKSREEALRIGVYYANKSVFSFGTDHILENNMGEKHDDYNR